MRSSLPNSISVPILLRNAGWIHCVGSGHVDRPWKARTWLKEGDMGEMKAGMLPYVTLAAGADAMLLANWFFQLPT
jgi:hypothetical protein